MLLLKDFTRDTVRFNNVNILFYLSISILILSVDVVESQANPNKVLVISFDGFRWDYYKKASNFTSIHRMIADGAWAVKGMKNVFVTKTFPNHYTLSTGLYTESHGIVGNYFYDPVFKEFYHGENETITSDPKWYSGEPIWVTNQRQDINSRSGSICWPSALAPVHGFRPYRSISYKTEQDFPYKERVKTVINWFTDEYPINLAMVYFENPDFLGHRYGPDSDVVLNKLFQLDNLLDELFWELKDANLLDKTDVIVLSDHGMTSIPEDDSYKIEVTDYLSTETFFVTSTNPVAGIWPSSPGSYYVKNSFIYKYNCH